MQLKPASEWSAEDIAAARYDMGLLAGPFLVGPTMVAYRALSESRVTGTAVHSIALAKNAVPQFMALNVPEEPLQSGVPPPPDTPEADAAPVADASSPGARVAAALESLGWTHAAAGGAAPLQADPGARPGILDHHRAFASGAASPVSVAEAIISFLGSEPGAQNWLCDWDPDHLRAQAAASAARYAAGRPLSVLDGVPYAVKDSVDVFALATGHGTAYQGKSAGPVPSVEQEAPCVAALRSLGAVCIGKTQMQEFGLLPTGINPRLGLARNPHDPTRIPGGSSGGSACVVAAGVCPFAIGSDAGGSIRIPAALCGVVGLKPTQGRMAMDADTCAMVTVGPLACSVADTMIAFAAMACPCSCTERPTGAKGPGAAADSHAAAPPSPVGAHTAEGAQAEVDAAARAVAATAAAPPPGPRIGEDVASRPPLALPLRLLPPEAGAAGGGADALFASQPLAGLRVGVFDPWFADCEPGVAAAARSGLSLLSRLGARVVAVVLPELEQLRVAASCLILAEMYAINRAAHCDPKQRAQLNEDTRIMLATAARMTGANYLQGQRVRRRQRQHWARAFEACDVVATPTVACVAQEIHPAASKSGCMHLPSTAQLLRYSIQANVMGLPALAVPVGADTPRGGSRPLPASLQIVGRPWHDATVLRAGAALEAALAAAGGGAPLPAAARMPNPLAAAARA